MRSTLCASLLAEPKEGYTNVYGSFTPTIPATLWLTLHVPLSGKLCPKLPDEYDTPPDSPLSSLSSSSRSPSISRTLLTEFDWDRPSVGPENSPCTSGDHHNAATLHPILKAAEKSSKLSCRTTCSTCMKTGTNFPRCPRCDEMWCSRACRLQGGKKHVCAIREM